MKVSKLMLASIFLTAAILAVLSGLAGQAMAQNAVAQAAPAQDLQPYQQREAQYQQREAQYQQVVEQANQQLTQANSELKSLQAQVAELKKQNDQPQATSANPVVESAAISPEKAGQIAQDAAEKGQALQKTPELVNFEGKVAYEAVFEKGSVYVDSQSGDVLFNGTVPLKITLAKATQVAEEYMKSKEVLQSDEITFRGAPMYRVIFKNGMMVYLDTTGQITYIQQVSPVVQVVAQSSGSSSSSPKSSSHESDDHDN